MSQFPPANFEYDGLFDGTGFAQANDEQVISDADFDNSAFENEFINTEVWQN